MPHSAGVTSAYAIELFRFKALARASINLLNDRSANKCRKTSTRSNTDTYTHTHTLAILSHRTEIIWKAVCVCDPVGVMQRSELRAQTRN